MINGDIEIFLDTGWYQDTNLFYNKFLYFLEGGYYLNTNKCGLSIYKSRGFMEEDNLHCKYYVLDGYYVDYEVVFNEKLDDGDLLKKHFLEAKIFDGKSFWEVEKDIILAEDDGDYEIKSLDEITK